MKQKWQVELKNCQKSRKGKQQVKIATEKSDNERAN